jgi:biopolymer transport protein ExbD
MEVPFVSMADMAFLLFVFAILTTVVGMENGVPVSLPAAETGQRLPRERVVRVWVARDGGVSIGGGRVTDEEIRAVMAAKLEEDPALTVALNADGDVSCRVISRVLRALQQAGALSIALTSDSRGR